MFVSGPSANIETDSWMLHNLLMATAAGSFCTCEETQGTNGDASASPRPFFPFFFLIL